MLSNIQNEVGGFTAYVVNNLRLAMGGVADELITVGGAFTIDGEKSHQR